MILDQPPLFVAAALCAAAMAVALLTVWLTSRSDRFLITWALGMVLLCVGVSLYLFAPFQRHDLMALAFALETLGFFALYVAALQFRGAPGRTGLVLAAAAISVAAVAVPIAAGFNGFGLMVYNLLVAVILICIAFQFWMSRQEAPASIAGITFLYGLAAFSFAACGFVILHEGRMVMAERPENWAEHLNAVMCIVGVTGIGALSLSLHQTRMALRHRMAALTDPLTDLLNRRALFDHFDGVGLQGDEALIAFDLDRFKSINDRYGHAAGDEILRRFAKSVKENLRAGDLAARIGGEEFVVLLRRATLPAATATAERIAAAFACEAVETEAGTVRASTSAGIALVKWQDRDVDALLQRADAALYKAKQSGRNRVVAELSIVA